MLGSCGPLLILRCWAILVVKEMNSDCAAEHCLGKLGPAILPWRR